MKLKENWFIPSISRKQTATSHLKQKTTTYGVRNPFPALVQERYNAMLNLLMGSQPSASNYRISYDNTYINNLKKKPFYNHRMRPTRDLWLILKYFQRNIDRYILSWQNKTLFNFAG
jgi:hypothetical protein